MDTYNGKFCGSWFARDSRMVGPTSDSSGGKIRDVTFCFGKHKQSQQDKSRQTMLYLVTEDSKSNCPVAANDNNHQRLNSNTSHLSLLHYFTTNLSKLTGGTLFHNFPQEWKLVKYTSPAVVMLRKVLLAISHISRQKHSVSQKPLLHRIIAVPFAWDVYY